MRREGNGDTLDKPTLLKLGFKAGEKAFIELDGKTVEIIVVGYSKAKYSLIFIAPREVKIIRDSAKNKGQEAHE